MSERYYRRAPDSLSASLPSQALRASSPKGRALGISVKFPLDEQSLSVSWTVVPCCPGQRQLDKVRCPEAAALCSKARPLAPYCASGVQLRAARPAKGSPRQGQQRRPPPVTETGRSCWGRGQQDASDSKADAGSRNPGSVTEGDGEGKPFTIKPLHSDKQTFCQSDTIVVLPILCQHPCPLRRSAPALPKGEPFIWKKRQTRICLFFHALIALLSPSFSA